MASMEPKLCDFGSSRELNSSFARSIVGTPLATAPEVLEGLPYNEKADIWSYGCLVLAVSHRALHGYCPESLKSIGILDMPLKLRSGELELLMPNDDGVAALARECCAMDTAARPNIASVLATTLKLLQETRQ